MSLGYYSYRCVISKGLVVRKMDRGLVLCAAMIDEFSNLQF